ncbi:hypothetical protein ACFY00_11915 [Kitasatospora sp. NPDC001540]
MAARRGGARLGRHHPPRPGDPALPLEQVLAAEEESLRLRYE